MRILLVKLTSMGDLIQALPAITELYRHQPSAKIDWVVDQAFAEIPKWHPAINKVYTTDHRKWGENPLSLKTWRALIKTIGEIRKTRYDLVIDMQNNYKSALITAFARGMSCGPARGGTAEPLVYLIYSKRIAVTIKQLAIDRWRKLLGGLFNYSIQSKSIDFKLAAKKWQKSQHQPQGNYLVFVTNASWNNKRLPQSSWITLASIAKTAGYTILLPWGKDQEREFAEQIHAQSTNSCVLPKLKLTQLASLLYHCDGAICNDTGLAHLSAALNTPTVTCYGPTNPQLIAATGAYSIQLKTDEFACAPCYSRTCTRNSPEPNHALCLASMQPKMLWQQLLETQKYKAARQNEDAGISPQLKTC